MSTLQRSSEAPLADDDTLFSTGLLDEPTSASSASDIAAIAYSLDADIERFISEVTIAETSTELSAAGSLEDVLEERRLREERRERIAARADEMLCETLAAEAHQADVRQLSAAVEALGLEKGAPTVEPAADDAGGGGAFGDEGAELDLDVSYPAFGAPDHGVLAGRPDAGAKASELKRESDLLRGFLRHGAYETDYKSHVERLRAELPAALSAESAVAAALLA